MDSELVINNLADIVDRILIVDEENVEQVVPSINPRVENNIQDEQQVPAPQVDPDDFDHLHRTPTRMNILRRGYMSPDSTTNIGPIRRQRRRHIPRSPSTPTPIGIRLRERAPRRHIRCTNCHANYHRGYVPPVLFLYENGTTYPYENHLWLQDQRFNRQNNITPSHLPIINLEYNSFDDLIMPLRPLRLNF